ncbi:MAG TPA: TetR/AcrR family transcriptional regulator [Solirubrobacteraceae bacterium]|nr:TetR/AcrR family transcriptional regulator [Solirubrobacteraceae bacterium]
MSTPEAGEIRRRRRGQELEAALLDAAWDELVEVGFAGLTMESVAGRARTGVAVLYRRWANKEQLVFAAIEHYRTARPLEVPDTGSLREDLLTLLTGFGTERATFVAVAAAAAFSGLLAGTGLTPAQAREKFVGDQPLWRAHAIYQRAHDRGEIDLDRLPPAVLTMPFDLVRHDLLMNLEPVGAERIRAVVDKLFLPLVHRHLDEPQDGTGPAQPA